MMDAEGRGDMGTLADAEIARWVSERVGCCDK